MIQDFGFQSTATKIKQTRDGELILAAGQYPPTLKAFSTRDMSLRFQRRYAEEIVTFESLNDDYSKIVCLRQDRYLEFWDKGSPYYKLRVPVPGRDMAYHYPTCDLVVVGNNNLIYRLNLEQGRYLKPLEGSSPAYNALAINPASGILAVGGNDGLLECWDPRDRSHLAAMKLEAQYVDQLGYDAEAEKTANSATSGITALRFAEDGLALAVGVATGQVLLYDIRMNSPLIEKDHQFDTPITDISFHAPSRNVVSSCRKVVRVWNKDTGKTFVNVEPSFEILTTYVVPNSGMIMVGGENPRMNIYHIPDLAPAPKWASFLDNMTDELEVTANKTVYHDYKFLTREEIDRLGISKLVGTPYLRPYMHGFFIDFRLYRRIRDIARPDEYREYLKQRVQEQMDKKRGSRISAQPVVKSGTKINQELLDAVSSKQGSRAAQNILDDDRFGRLFQDPNMKVDFESEAFKRTASRKFSESLAKDFAEVGKPASGYESDEVDDEEQVDAYGFTAEDDDQPSRKKNKKVKERRSDPISAQFVQNGNGKADDDDADMPAKKKVRLLEAQDDLHDSPFAPSDEKRRQQNASFAARIAKAESFTTDGRVATMGALQMKFTPEEDMKEKRAFKEARDEYKKTIAGRRSMRGMMNPNKR